jgi:serine phosphatase RsbU (regulator of sigma subunit)
MSADTNSAADLVREVFPAQISARFEATVTAWSRSAGGARAGGDWCDAFAISEDTIAVTVGDVSGHGAPVAKTMAAMRASVLRTLHDTRAPSDVLVLANEAAFNHGDGTIVTAIVAFVNWRQRTLAFANAGHPPPLLLTVGGQAFLEHPPADLPIGIFATYHAADYAIALPAGAMLVFYTDGITEHERDLVRGEVELAQAARWVFERPEIDAAHAIARQLVGQHPVLDDAATIVLRLPPP